ncbi:MAG: TolC family protein, partial [Bdellovibrionales bacterium]|nr:TolC family protein [Bdellovibrionales bacterium]
MQNLLAFLFGLFAAFSIAQAQTTLSLHTYKKQVEKHDPRIRGAELAREGARLSENSAEQITDLKFIINGYYSDDKRPTTNPSFSGDRTKSEYAGIGFQKQFLYGPTLELTQNYSHVEVFDASPLSVPLANYYDSYPKISLTVPLWQNFLGSKTQAMEEGLKNQSKSSVLNADIEYVQANSKIEMAYYKLAAMQENQNIQREILDRAQRISDWVTSQYKRGLVDVADTHQAQAAVTLRKIELQQSENNLKMAAREFNLLRGMDSDAVSEKLWVDS